MRIRSNNDLNHPKVNDIVSPKIEDLINAAFKQPDIYLSELIYQIHHEKNKLNYYINFLINEIESVRSQGNYLGQVFELRNGDVVSFVELAKLSKHYYRLMLQMSYLINNLSEMKVELYQDLVISTLIFIQDMISFNRVLLEIDIDKSQKDKVYIRIESEIKRIFVEVGFTYLFMLDSHEEIIAFKDKQQLLYGGNFYKALESCIKEIGNYISNPGLATHKNKFNPSQATREVCLFAHYLILKAILFLYSDNHEAAKKYFTVVEELYPTLDLTILNALNTHRYMTLCCLEINEKITIDDDSDFDLMLEKASLIEKTLFYGKGYLTKETCDKLSSELELVDCKITTDKQLIRLLNSYDGLGINFDSKGCCKITLNKMGSCQVGMVHNFLTEQGIKFKHKSNDLYITKLNYSTIEKLICILSSIAKSMNEISWNDNNKNVHEGKHVEVHTRNDFQNKDTVSRAKFRSKVAKTGKCVPYTVCFSLAEAKLGFFHMSILPQNEIQIPVSNEDYEEVKHAISHPSKNWQHKFEYNEDKNELQIRVTSIKRKVQFFAEVTDEMADKNGNLHYMATFDSRM